MQSDTNNGEQLNNYTHTHNTHTHTIFIHVHRIWPGRFSLWVRVYLSWAESTRIIISLPFLLLCLITAREGGGRRGEERGGRGRGEREGREGGERGRGEREGREGGERGRDIDTNISCCSIHLQQVFVVLQTL